MLQLYLVIRKPRNFLVLLCLFISTSLALHFMHGYDSDWGATNLMLSIEATIAGAVLMMKAEESAEMQRQNSIEQAKMLAGVLAIAEAQREILADNAEVLRALRDSNERVLKALIEGETS
ncbi:hypothetical protein [Pararobbsia silviterrae]|uniref:DUF1003 domain-containing protein n=1 Tax=Pararobbsia silviterrae TaxID=1792498 RepID=A0A494Y6X3_9BURK|nr:hypothetical protein [Pararobbsia silviterrae]RKP56351.1 hypothetical protein D7S86_08100 [Pararobbsia silviterrae]